LLYFTQPAKDSSFKTKKQPKTQRTEFAEITHQQLNAFAVCFWLKQRMAFIITA
jgi:hypothetical protein